MFSLNDVRPIITYLLLHYSTSLNIGTLRIVLSALDISLSVCRLHKFSLMCYAIMRSRKNRKTRIEIFTIINVVYFFNF